MTVKPFDEHVNKHLDKVERSYGLSSPDEGFDALRPLGLEDFGNVLWNMPSDAYPKLSAELPKMTPDEVTVKWTGSSGLPLLLQSISFVRSCAENYAAITGKSLREKRILDFGCGYGRFLRLFSFYSNEVYGVDAWEISLDHSRAAGFGTNIKKSDEVPDHIPFDEKFDFLFSFSVFTHLSEKATIASLNSLRKAAHDGAILVITIRPVEFWSIAAEGKTHLKPSNMDAMIADHRQSGFAFYVQDHPNYRQEERHYGDTSMTLEWLLDKASGWKFEASDRSLNNPYQRYIFFRAV